MQNNLFDHIIKQAVENASTEVPKGLWEKIAQENNKRKPIPFWHNSNIGFAVVAVCMGIALYFIGSNSAIIPLTQKTNNLSATDIPAFEKQNNTTALSSTTNTVNTFKPENIISSNNTTSVATITNLTATTIFSPNNIINTSENNTVETEEQNTIETILKPVQITTEAIPTSTLASTTTANTLLQNSINKALIFNLACPGETKYPWMIEAFASPDYSRKNFTAGSVSDFFLRRKDSTENLKMGFSIGVRLSKKITDNIALKTGVQFAQINERVTLVTENERRLTTVITVRSVVRAPGDTIFVRDTSSVTQIGYLTRKIKNRYRNLEIPLLASYETNGNNWKFAATAGAIVNISSWYSGFVLDTSNQLVPISSKDVNGFYQSQIGISFYSSISAIKRVNENVELFAEPYLRVGLNNHSTSDVGFNQRFSGIGFNMGLRFKLSSKGNKTE